MSFKNRLIAVTPMICLFFFLLLGFAWDLWHPGWLVFLLIPIMPYLVGKKKLRFSIPLIITRIYLIMGFGWNLWHPGWIIFLLIPVFTTLIGSSKIKIIKKDANKNDEDYIDIE